MDCQKKLKQTKKTVHRTGRGLVKTEPYVTL